MNPNNIEIQAVIESSAQAYYRLVLIVGVVDSGKTLYVKDLSKKMNIPILNLNISLAEKLIGLSERQRKIQCQVLLQEIVDSQSGQYLIIDNIELLFDLSLSIDPLRALESVSRNKCLICTWPGSLQGEKLVYADANHTEYRSYNSNKLMIVNLNLNQ